MSKWFVVLLIWFLTSISSGVFAQEELRANHHLFLDLGGPGGFGSLNYEQQWHIDSSTSIGARLGLSTYTLTDFTARFNPDIILPFTVSYLYGNDHILEAGAGMSMASIVAAGNDFTPQRGYRYYGNITLGYRYQKTGNSLVYRVGYSPLYSFEEYFHWAFISIGYAF